MIKIKRVYEPAMPDDGQRFLNERLWPRGIKKEQLKMGTWLKDVAPSTKLRQWFSHDPAKWAEFQQRYSAELQSHAQALVELLDVAQHETVTLLYSARDTEHNSAIVLQAFLEKKLGTKK